MHHSVYSQGITLDQVMDFAEMCGVELVVIGADMNIRSFTRDLRHNEVYYSLRPDV